MKTRTESTDEHFPLELSIVMPCLNEAETLGKCISDAQEFLKGNNVQGEIVVADNGSTDKSLEIATQYGARVVHVRQKGYGAAIRGGILGSYGKFCIIGDADDSYDFFHLDDFLKALRKGADIVMGNRFKGTIYPGAMPWKNKYIGNPILSLLGRTLFNTQIGDFHCGLRGITRQAFEKLSLTTPGMEFASEMVGRAAMRGLVIAEVPTSLRPDGRSRPPHLRPWRDGVRHVLCMLRMRIQG